MLSVLFNKDKAKSFDRDGNTQSYTHIQTQGQIHKTALRQAQIQTQTTDTWMTEDIGSMK